MRVSLQLEPGDVSDSDDDVPNALPPSSSSSSSANQSAGGTGPDGSPRALVQGVVMSDDTDPFVANNQRNSTRQNAPYDNVFKLKVRPGSWPFLNRCVSTSVWAFDVLSAINVTFLCWRIELSVAVLRELPPNVVSFVAHYFMVPTRGAGATHFCLRFLRAGG